VRETLRVVADVMARRRAVTPYGDPPDVVRVDAEFRAAARAHREQADSLVADLTQLLRTPPPVAAPCSRRSLMVLRTAKGACQH
jgi:hypothetical protein